MSFPGDRFAPCQSVEGLPTIANFSVHGTECVVVDSSVRECEQLEIIGALTVNGHEFVVACGSRGPSGGDALAALSPRELEIARCVAAGYPTKAIAQRLRISYYTVRVHLGRIYCKLGLHKQTELASWISAHYGRQWMDV
jgi:DNA-binding CsgD family transcriptional regulator